MSKFVQYFPQVGDKVRLAAWPPEQYIVVTSLSNLEDEAKIAKVSFDLTEYGCTFRYSGGTYNPGKEDLTGWVRKKLFKSELEYTQWILVTELHGLEIET